VFAGGFLAGTAGAIVKESLKEDGYVEGNEAIVKNAFFSGISSAAFGFLGAQIPGLEKGAKLVLEYLFNVFQLCIDTLRNYLTR
jgi:hypothetical protein